MKTRQEQIEDFLSDLDTEVDVLACVDVDNVEDFASLYSEIEDSEGFDIDIIYFSNAMDYLLKNDPSLQESCALAAAMGCDLANVNSEFLASLLSSQNTREEFNDLESEIDAFFDELEDTFECDECGEVYATEEEAEECKHIG